jgi:hypothetical protein
MTTSIIHGMADFTDGDYLDEFSTEGKTDVSERRGTDGAIAKVKDYNPTSEISVKGGGNPAIAVGVGSLSITSLSGGAQMIKSSKHTEKNTDFDDFDLSGTHYPSASVAS